MKRKKPGRLRTLKIYEKRGALLNQLSEEEKMKIFKELAKDNFKQLSEIAKKVKKPTITVARDAYFTMAVEKWLKKRKK